jgi:molybdenum cofactor cytidylyltransferase
MSVAAIVLAAGRGTRFGDDPKLLAMLDGKPLVRHVVEAACASVARPVLVVTGHRAEEVERAIADLPAHIVRNADYADGLSTSLKAGFAALPNGVDGGVILLGDMPRVRARLIDELALKWESAGCPAALVPVHAGRRGNPVILSRSISAAVAGLTGDTGAGPLLRERNDIVLSVMDDAAILQDVDTPETLSEMRR